MTSHQRQYDIIWHQMPAGALASPDTTYIM